MQQILNFIQKNSYKHIGIYGFTSEILSQICKLPYSENEVKNKLEQLRWLDNGYQIKIAKTDSNGQVETDENGEIIYVPFSESYRQDIQARLHGINKYLNGVYNDFDKGTMQKYSVGRLALMYRKHVVPGYKRRFKRIKRFCSTIKQQDGITNHKRRCNSNTR